MIGIKSKSKKKNPNVKEKLQIAQIKAENYFKLPQKKKKNIENPPLGR